MRTWARNTIKKLGNSLQSTGRAAYTWLKPRIISTTKAMWRGAKGWRARFAKTKTARLLPAVAKYAVLGFGLATVIVMYMPRLMRELWGTLDFTLPFELKWLWWGLGGLLLLVAIGALFFYKPSFRPATKSLRVVAKWAAAIAILFWLSPWQWFRVTPENRVILTAIEPCTRIPAQEGKFSLTVTKDDWSPTYCFPEDFAILSLPLVRSGSEIYRNCHST